LSPKDTSISHHHHLIVGTLDDWVQGIRLDVSALHGNGPVQIAVLGSRKRDITLRLGNAVKHRMRRLDWCSPLLGIALYDIEVAPVHSAIEVMVRRRLEPLLHGSLLRLVHPV
jgi:hypothetical protein